MQHDERAWSSGAVIASSFYEVPWRDGRATGAAPLGQHLETLRRKEMVEPTVPTGRRAGVRFTTC